MQHLAAVHPEKSPAAEGDRAHRRAGRGEGRPGPLNRAQNTDEVRAKATMKVAASVAPAVMLNRAARSEAFFTDMVILPISQGRRHRQR